MNGTVRTEEKCPKCREAFQNTNRGLRCARCKRKPEKYYIDFWWRGERIRVFRDKDGYPFTSFETANRFLTVMRAEVDAGKFNPKDYIRVEVRGLQFANYAMAWIERRRREVERELLSRGYLRGASACIRNHMIPFFKNRSIRDIHGGFIEDFMAQLPAHLKPKSIANIMGVLQKIFRDAYRRQDITRLPVIPQVSVSAPETKWLQEEDQTRILAEITDPMRRAFFLFLFKQGCRPGEARALKWGRVYLEISKVVICAAMDQGVYKDRTKEGDVRILPLAPEVQAVLEALPQGTPEDFVFNLRGKPFSHTMVYETWKKASRKLGIEISCYQGTRHSAASQAVSAGVPMEVVKEFLGHKCASSTRRYAHLDSSTLVQFWNRQQTVSKPEKFKANLLTFQGKRD